MAALAAGLVLFVALFVVLGAARASAQPRAVSLLRAAHDEPGLSVSFWPRRLRPGEHFAWSAPCSLPCTATLDRTVYVRVHRGAQTIELPDEFEGLRGGEYVLRAESFEPRTAPWALMGLGAATLVGGIASLIYMLADAAYRWVGTVGSSGPQPDEAYWGAAVVIGLGVALLVGGGIWVSETPPRTEMRRVGRLPREAEDEEESAAR